MENRDIKKKTLRRRALTLVVLAAILVVSLTGGSLAVYNKSTSLFGNIAFLFPSPSPTDPGKDLSNMTNMEWMAYMIGEDSTVYKYFALHGRTKGSTLDSNGRNFAPSAWDEVHTLIGKIGGDPADAVGWRIWMDSDDVGWNIFWTTTDLAQAVNKQVLPYVWKYNSKTDIIEDGSSAVLSKTVDKYVINQIHGGGFVKGVHPAVATPSPTPTPTPSITPSPTPELTVEPTLEPTIEPTIEPTVEPAVEPTAEPTVEATEPAGEPTQEPVS